LSVRELENAFVEFRPHLGGCRFYNCQHLNEPGCAVIKAVEHGDIASARMNLYRQLHSELKIHHQDYE
jgi:ribosome biogenesis GTPase